jgi:hypothetical protein
MVRQKRLCRKKAATAFPVSRLPTFPRRGIDSHLISGSTKPADFRSIAQSRGD